MEPMKELLRAFLNQLIQGKILELHISQDVDIEQDLENAELEYPVTLSQSIVRKFSALGSRRKYLQIFILAGLVAELQANKKTMLMRDVYYSLKYIFNQPTECSYAIVELGRILRVRRHEMGIIPSMKSKMFGPIRFAFRNSLSSAKVPSLYSADPNCSLQPSTHIPSIPTMHSSIMKPQPPPYAEEFDTSTLVYTHCSREDSGGVLLEYSWVITPPSCIHIELTRADVLYIVVVEKEAIFHRLIEDKFINEIPSVLVTSCGYPDVAVRAVVHYLYIFFPWLTVVGLSDCNPHGFRLMQCFKCPSQSSLFEAVKFSSDLKWLGLHPSHIRQLSLLNNKAFQSAHQVLSHRDVSMLKRLLCMDYVQNDILLRDELEAMLEGGIKCELEALYAFGVEYVVKFVRHLITGEGEN